MTSQELLDILRCPVCVHNEPEGGELDRNGNWLICRDCSRKYPIRDDIPVMLIDEGDRYRDIPKDELPEVPPPEEISSVSSALDTEPMPTENWLPILLLAAAGLITGVFFVWLIVKKLRSE